MRANVDILGQGIYTPTAAARLIGGKRADVIRWVHGSGRVEPLWRAQYAEISRGREVSFADLMELRVVVALRNAGLSLQAIRFAIGLAKERFGLDRPLSTRSFRTDGREIFLDAAEEAGLFSLARKSAGQKVFRDIVAPSFVDLEFEAERPVRWRPRGAPDIVVDPQRLFGEPILDAEGIATRVLREEFEAFQDTKYLARIYQVPECAIKAGINFERSLDGQGPL